MFNSEGDRRLTDYVFKGCAEVIDKLARQNDLRYKYADIMAANRWVNRDMDGLVNAIVGALPVLEKQLARANDRLQDWIDNAIAMMVDGHFAGVVLKSSAADSLDNQTFQEMKREANAFIDICNDRGGGGRGYDRGGDYGGSSYGRGTSDIGQIATGYGHQRNGGGGAAGLDDGWSAIAKAATTGLDEPREEPRREEPARRADPLPNETPLAYREPEVPLTAIEGPDYTKADPWKEFWQQGEHWQVAHHSKWKLTEALDGEIRKGIELVPRYYDINTHLKYYVMNQSGEVREELIEVNDDNKYQAHQLRSTQESDFKPPVRSAGMSLNPRANKPLEDDIAADVLDDAPVPDLVAMLSAVNEEQMISDTEPALITDSMAAAVFSSRAKMLSAGAVNRVELSVMRTPVVIRDLEQVELINRVFESPTLLAAANAMNDLKGQFEPNLWFVLNRRITEKLQHATRYAFQYNGLTDAVNFADHFEKIINHVAGKRGQEWAAAYAGRAKYVLATACGHLNPDDLSDGLSGLGSPENINAVVFADYQVIVSLDYTLDQIGLGKALVQNEMGLAVTQTDHPKLHAALLRVYKKLDEFYSAVQVRVVISTSDNRLVEIVPYSAKTSSFVLALLS